MSEHSHLEVSEGRGKFRLIVGAIAAAALALFVFQNIDSTEVNFLWMTGSISLALLLVITVGLTVVLTLVGLWILRRRQN